ncbi:hypothetical protein OF83DRAFT_1073158 [Amylostereum chailletii]|nr:hypothetical protein OF83DRAFT_1073158 [Amylostereum chailletii]
MTLGSRAETIDGHMDNSNWKKMVGMGEPFPAEASLAGSLAKSDTLCKKWCKTLTNLKARTATLLKILEMVALWQQ